MGILARNHRDFEAFREITIVERAVGTTENYLLHLADAGRVCFIFLTGNRDFLK